jgi:hypothetical protein
VSSSNTVKQPWQQKTFSPCEYFLSGQRVPQWKQSVEAGMEAACGSEGASNAGKELPGSASAEHDDSIVAADFDMNQ